MAHDTWWISGPTPNQSEFSDKEDFYPMLEVHGTNAAAGVQLAEGSLLVDYKCLVVDGHFVESLLAN